MKDWCDLNDMSFEVSCDLKDKWALKNLCDLKYTYDLKDCLD